MISMKVRHIQGGIKRPKIFFAIVNLTNCPRSASNYSWPLNFYLVMSTIFPIGCINRHCTLISRTNWQVVSTL